MFKDRDPEAKDRDFFLKELRTKEQERIRGVKERIRNREQSKGVDLRLKENNNTQSPQIKNLRSSPANESVKDKTVVELRPQTQTAANNNEQAKVKSYFDQSFKMKNGDNGLFGQMIEQIGEGAKHQWERKQQKSQLKTEQVQQKQQAQQQTRQARSR